MNLTTETLLDYLEEKSLRDSPEIVKSLNKLNENINTICELFIGDYIDMKSIIKLIDENKNELTELKNIINKRWEQDESDLLVIQ